MCPPIAEQLGIDQATVLEIMVRRLEAWVEVCPALTVVPDPSMFLTWYWEVADDDQQNAVLAALLEVGFRDGFDDAEAATVLCWLLERAARTVISDLCSLPGRASSGYEWLSEQPAIERVAAALWIECRTAHGRPHVEDPGSTKVAAKIQGWVRQEVFAQVGHVGTIFRRHLDRTPLMTATYGTVPESLFDEDSAVGFEGVGELDWVLESAVADGVISPECRQILEGAVEVAGDDCRFRAGRPPLSKRNISRLAERENVSARQLYRSAQDALERLREYAMAGGFA
ncbi:MAG: hypothetical protein LBR20_06540 [Propionibacteriaceae bacterium]|jgi:hypothetical protein|nr:hypothetical protein [Propionibacteriaceae bacterium]